VLHDSRDEPWSEAERAFHRILRALRLPWSVRTNYLVRTGPGGVYVDAAVPELQLGFEVDGYEYHGTREAFEHDRLRIADLGLVGWQIFPLAAATILDQPEETELIVERLVRRRARLLGRVSQRTTSRLACWTVE
jgi:very-short-patch-repair endonuclease